MWDFLLTNCTTPAMEAEQLNAIALLLDDLRARGEALRGYL